MSNAPRKPPRRAAAVLQLRVDLLDSQPLVWRRLQVPAMITLRRLHQILQVTFGWRDEHLHEFRGSNASPSNLEADEWIVDTESSEQDQTLAQALAAGHTLDYVYDFGDHWVHRITLERPALAIAGARLPFCVDGAHAAPPEDCGGVQAYTRLLTALTDPDDPLHATSLRVLGHDWNALRFDREAINRLLGTTRL